MYQNRISFVPKTKILKIINIVKNSSKIYIIPKMSQPLFLTIKDEIYEKIKL